MKNKIKSLFLAAMLCVTSIPFVGNMITNAEEYPLEILSSDYYSEEIDWDLWDKFIKYDLCITDYNSLTDEEKELCKFIFETERAADDTIICERARRILTGYDVGERITLEQVESFYNIQDSKFIDNDYPYYFNEEYAADNAILRKVPDIRHLDWNVNTTEYWLDDEGKERIFTTGEDFTYSDNLYENFYLYKKYDDNGNIIEEKEILRNTEEIETIEYGSCIYQIYPDSTLQLFEVVDKSIESVTVPEYINDMPVMSIKAYAFKDSEITDIVLPDTLEYIEAFAFMNCTKLNEINFPEGLDALGTGAFDSCTSLGNIIIDCPNLQIGKLPFSEACAKNVTINTKVIPSSALSSFESFESFNIGKDTVEIGFHFLESDLELNKNTEIPQNVKVISSEGGYFPYNEITVPSSIEIFGAYDDAIGKQNISLGETGAEIPLLENECVFYQNATIKGWYNTEAHRYAVEWGLKFVPLDENISYGDTNLDGEIGIADAVLLQSYVVGDDVTIGFEADLTKDGLVDVFDLNSMRGILIKQ